MGMHRICRGDASDMSAVRRLFGDSRATLVVTSPPYYNQRDYAHWSSYDLYLADMARVIAAITTVAAGPFACCWNVGDCVRDGLDVPADHSLIFRHLGFRYRDKIAWVKPMPVYSVQRWRHIGSARYFPALQWEPILVFTRNGHPRFERDDIPLVKRNHSNVWKIDPVPAASQKKIGHPAVFPAEAFLRSACRGQYQPGDTVLRTTTEGWVAILAREGSLEGTVDGSAVEVAEPELLIVSGLSVTHLRATTACEVAFAVGWPPEARTGAA